MVSAPTILSSYDCYTNRYRYLCIMDIRAKVTYREEMTLPEGPECSTASRPQSCHQNT
jgi:hypothetical protein